MTSLVRDISDTARWVAVLRAEESERPDAVFRDPFARRLAGRRGSQIASAIEFSRANSWSFVARTYLFDAVIPEPEGPKGQFPWSGVCVLENIRAVLDG